MKKSQLEYIQSGRKSDGPIVVSVPSGPLGLQLGTDFSGKTATVQSFHKMPTGSIGAVERHGKVSIGDVLIQINDKDVSELSYRDVTSYLNKLDHMSRKLVFLNSRTYYRNKRLNFTGVGKDSSGTSSVACAVTDTRIVRENGRPQYAEYKVSVAAPNPYELEAPIKRWITWKRYSEFHSLDRALRKELGWKFSKVQFPPKRTFFNLEEKFIQGRKEALDEYLSQVLSIRGVSDFRFHTSSQDLKSFLEYNAYIVPPDRASEIDETNPKETTVISGAQLEAGRNGEPKRTNTEVQPSVKKVTYRKRYVRGS
mmetsp:Transcript_18422/g.24041  ORF Transcript_18422/g.24041 Transcript_18422/m.24041 type:complete len:311 (+) Transcript_18422:169-1101(+)